MSMLSRQGTEILRIANCPCCGGDVSVSDCGYSTFNPGSAKCCGECKRKWNLGGVDDRWDAGLKWNKKAARIKQRLAAFRLVKVDRKMSVRDFAREALEKEAKQLICEMESSIIGAEETETT